VPCVWSDCLEKLENNEINVMVDVAYSDDRAQIFDFNTIPIINNWAVSYSSSDSVYSSIDDLNGTKISVLKGGIHADGPYGIKSLLNSFNITVTYSEVDSYVQVLEQVSNKSVDFGIVNRLFALVNEAKFTHIKRSFLVFNAINLHFAFYKGSDLTRYLISTIDNEISKLLIDSDSEYYQIMNKYLFDFDSDSKIRIIPEWVIPAIILFIIFIIGLLILNFVFKKQLNLKTSELQELIRGQDAEVKKATQHLIEANEKLKELDRLKSIFLASMSHELLTPLNSIIGFTKILLMGMTGELNDEQKKQLKLVESSSQHLLDLINDILDIAKIESETIQLYYETFDLNAYLEEIVNSTKPLIGNKNIKIQLDMKDQITTTCEKRRLKQILYNLLSNAVKFSEKGEVHVVLAEKEGNFFEISIEDEGIGIKEQDLNKLFTPFYQVDSSTTKKYEGTGLGLYISKRLCKILGGDLSISSVFNKGTKVTFFLPI
jgi:signal transduction histidine kinase